MIYAHTKEDPISKKMLPEVTWQTLEKHLTIVAEKTEAFAARFHAGALGRAAGLLHDAGKATDAFQARLHGAPDRADHKTEGARQAVAQYGSLMGRILAYAIAGHHTGIPDFASDTAQDTLSQMLSWPSERLLVKTPELPDKEKCRPFPVAIKTREHAAFAVFMLIKMLHSCLVDADYLDTEAFMQPEVSAARGEPVPLARLMELFQPELDRLLAYAQDTRVNIARRAVLSNCLEAAKRPRGFYTLTVPTGGGKTLSSLAFALKHAQAHSRDCPIERVIYAIPFTSITEQTASVFRKIFGSELVLEHHSNVDLQLKEANDKDAWKETARLASQNWDCPLIVTTSVQLFDSIFSNLPTRSRKLHNLANSVIILDEAQTLPDRLLLPTLAALKSLCADYGATVVFCTATQPNLAPEWLKGLEPSEIIENPQALFDALRRTQIEYLGNVSDDALAQRLDDEPQALVIVNTKKHASTLYDKIKTSDGAFHLSTSMCPEHRSQVLKVIKQRLKAGLPCVVISTQLVEAGVDISFPCVYRSISGMDSIAQAAGRCNREGELLDAEGNDALGRVYVFDPEGGLPCGWFQQMAEYGRETLQAFAGDPLGPESIANFFQKRYGMSANLDVHGILSHLYSAATAAGGPAINFATIAEQYQMIDCVTVPIIIPYDQHSRELIAEAERARYPHSYLRRLQRYTVSVYSNALNLLRDKGYIKQIEKGMVVLEVDDVNYQKVYSEEKGLDVEAKNDFLNA